MNNEAQGKTILEIVETNANERHALILRFAKGEIPANKMIDEIRKLDIKLEHQQLNWMADNRIFTGPADDQLTLSPDELFGTFNWN